MVDEGGTAAGAHDFEKNANDVGGGQGRRGEKRLLCPSRSTSKFYTFPGVIVSEQGNWHQNVDANVKA